MWGRSINVGSDEGTTIRELADLVIRLTGSSSSIVHIPPRPMDPRGRKPDIGKAWKLLGWRPQVPLVEGLKLAIEWYRRLSSHGRA